MGRKIAAIVAGVLVVMVVVLTLQLLGTMLHPLPEGLDPMDPESSEALAEHMSRAPLATWILAFGSEILGAFLGGLTAAWIVLDRKAGFAAAIFVVALAGSILNWTSFAHPIWFVLGQLVAYPLAYLLVLRILRMGPPPPAPEAAA